MCEEHLSLVLISAVDAGCLLQPRSGDNKTLTSKMLHSIVCWYVYKCKKLNNVHKHCFSYRLEAHSIQKKKKTMIHATVWF